MNTRLGIIGAGQLGLYLCEAAQKLGIKVAVLSDTEDAPALAVADSTFIGAIDNPGLLNQFLADCDVITFDKEDIPDQTLARLVAAQKQGRISVQALQKTWVTQQNLPTLPFQILSNGQTSLGDLAGSLGDTLVQKARCGGYDGRGVQILGPENPDSELWNIPSIVEPMRGHCPESAGTDQLEDGGTAVYWYGKAPGKAGRKMGHINTVAPSVASAREMGGRALAALQSNNQEHAA